MAIIVVLILMTAMFAQEHAVHAFATKVSFQPRFMSSIGEMRTNSATPVPPGRIEDIDEWMQLSSDSLKKFHGQSLFERMGVSSFQEIHNHNRYAVMSHGIQDDPIFCYANVAARETFLYSEDEIYQLPSRYSAPTGGGERSNRQEIMNDAGNNEFWIIKDGIRQRKDKSLFMFTDVILWNVYDKDGARVGQSAIYDREKIVEVESLDG